MVYLIRTIPDISSLFQLLEDAICLQLLLSLTGHTACSAIERHFSLPCRFGGLGVANPTSICDSQFCDSQFAASIQITAPLKKLIIEQSISAQPLDVRSIKAQVHQDRRETSRERALEIRNSLSPALSTASASC